MSVSVGYILGSMGYNRDWICDPFSQAIFVGNGQAAILERLTDAHAGTRAVSRVNGTLSSDELSKFS